MCALATTWADTEPNRTRLGSPRPRVPTMMRPASTSRATPSNTSAGGPSRISASACSPRLFASDTSASIVRRTAREGMSISSSVKGSAMRRSASDAWTNQMRPERGVDNAKASRLARADDWEASNPTTIRSIPLSPDFWGTSSVEVLEVLEFVIALALPSGDTADSLAPPPNPPAEACSARDLADWSGGQPPRLSSFGRAPGSLDSTRRLGSGRGPDHWNIPRAQRQALGSFPKDPRKPLACSNESAESKGESTVATRGTPRGPARPRQSTDAGVPSVREIAQPKTAAGARRGVGGAHPFWKPSDGLASPRVSPLPGVIGSMLQFDPATRRDAADPTAEGWHHSRVLVACDRSTY